MFTINKVPVFLIVLLLPIYSGAADVVPYSITLIKLVGANYIELIGPGKIQINNEVLPYKGTKYININNIGTLTSVTGETKGCMVAYSSEGYTANISVGNQSCNEILTIIAKIK